MTIENLRRGNRCKLKTKSTRQMFRLEERRPGSDMELATRVATRWIATDCNPEAGAKIARLAEKSLLRSVFR